MHVERNSSSGGRLPMKGNITWGGGNSSFKGRMQRGENSFCGGWMFVGVNGYWWRNVFRIRNASAMEGLRDGGIQYMSEEIV